MRAVTGMILEVSPYLSVFGIALAPYASELVQYSLSWPVVVCASLFGEREWYYRSARGSRRNSHRSRSSRSLPWRHPRNTETGTRQRFPLCHRSLFSSMRPHWLSLPIEQCSRGSVLPAFTLGLFAPSSHKAS